MFGFFVFISGVTFWVFEIVLSGCGHNRLGINDKNIIRDNIFIKKLFDNRVMQILEQ